MSGCVRQAGGYNKMRAYKMEDLDVTNWDDRLIEWCEVVVVVCMLSSHTDSDQIISHCECTGGLVGGRGRSQSQTRNLCGPPFKWW